MNIRDEKRNRNRTRKHRIVFCVNDKELKYIDAKMKSLHCTNRGAYLRDMALFGECTMINYSEFAKAVRTCNYLIDNAADNINQIARRVNATSNLYAEDIRDLQKQLDVISEMQREIMGLFLDKIKEK